MHVALLQFPRPQEIREGLDVRRDEGEERGVRRSAEWRVEEWGGMGGVRRWTEECEGGRRSGEKGGGIGGIGICLGGVRRRAEECGGGRRNTEEREQ